jgi:hypothetical protein
MVSVPPYWGCPVSACVGLGEAAVTGEEVVPGLVAAGVVTAGVVAPDVVAAGLLETGVVAACVEAAGVVVAVEEQPINTRAQIKIHARRIDDFLTTYSSKILL